MREFDDFSVENHNQQRDNSLLNNSALLSQFTASQMKKRNLNEVMLKAELVEKDKLIDLKNKEIISLTL